MRKEYLSVKKLADGGELFYLDVGKKEHYKPVYRIWVDRRLVEKDEKGYPFITTPLRGVDIVVKEGGSLKLTLGDKVLYNLFVQCGYRGDSTIKLVNVDETDKVFSYVVYRSERGSLGVSEGKLVLSNKDKIIAEWFKTGRTYGSATFGVVIITADGKESWIDNIRFQDLQDELQDNTL